MSHDVWRRRAASPEPLPEASSSTNEKPRKIYTPTNGRQSDLYSEVALAKNGTI